MWQLKLNLFVYALAYDLSAEPMKVLEKANAALFAASEDYTHLLIPCLGLFMIGYLQDKLGSAFVLNLSQMSVALMNFFALGYFLKQNGGLAKRYFTSYSEQIAQLPDEWLQYLSFFNMMAHSMAIATAAVAALRPFEGGRHLLEEAASIVSWYAFGQIASRVIATKSDFDASEKLLFCGGILLVVWFLNHITFPERRTASMTLALKVEANAAAEEARTGKRPATKTAKPTADHRQMDSAGYDLATYPELLVRHAGVLLLVILARASRVAVNIVAPAGKGNSIGTQIAASIGGYLQDASAHATVPTPATLSTLTGMSWFLARFQHLWQFSTVRQVGYVGIGCLLLIPMIIPQLRSFFRSLFLLTLLFLGVVFAPQIVSVETAIALFSWQIVVPLLLKTFLPNPTAVLRFVAAFTAVIVAGLIVASNVSPAPSSAEVPISIDTPAVLLLRCCSRLLYLVPAVVILAASIPGTFGQTLAMLTVTSDIMGEFLPSAVQHFADVVEHKMLVSERQEKEMLTVLVLCVTFLVSLAVSTARPPVKRLRR
jgi:hypothetical protein